MSSHWFLRNRDRRTSSEDVLRLAKPRLTSIASNSSFVHGLSAIARVNIVVSQKEPHHVLFFEVYDTAAALDAHRQIEHFKSYQVATEDMVANRQ
jgi:hypothetical protein